MRFNLLLWLLMPVLPALANMASPVQPGDRPASPFLGRHAAVVNESIDIRIAPGLGSADFTVIYSVHCDSAAGRVPLLFYAAGLSDSIRVWLDGKEISLLPLPEHLEAEGTGLAREFPYLYGPDEGSGYLDYAALEESGEEIRIQAKDLRYFETALDSGSHEFRIVYAAQPWSDRSDWIRKTTYRYALYPARHWKSFNGLQLSVQMEDSGVLFSSNLGPPHAGMFPGTTNWRFDALPADEILLSFQPEPDRRAAFLLRIGPDRLLYGLAGLLLICHVAAMWWYRQSRPAKRLSWAWLTGSLVLPLAVLASYPIFIGMIDSAIGAAASQYHGYSVLVVGLYPVVMPIYAVLTFLTDLYFKRSLQERSSGNG